MGIDTEAASVTVAYGRGLAERVGGVGLSNGGGEVCGCCRRGGCVL
jgi:hypothetical protein